MIKLVPQDADEIAFRRTAGIFQSMSTAIHMRKSFANAREEDRTFDIVRA
jgi:hypothetical protein